MKTYSVTFRYHDRKLGPEGRTIRIQASNVRVSIAKATRDFLYLLDRKQRYDANKELRIVATLVPEAIQNET